MRTLLLASVLVVAALPASAQYNDPYGERDRSRSIYEDSRPSQREQMQREREANGGGGGYSRPSYDQKAQDSLYSLGNGSRDLRVMRPR